MAEEKMRKGKKRKGTAPSNAEREVQLAPAVEFIHEHLTEALCCEVFQGIRTTERERKWSLFALARFWLAVVLEAPPSLSHLLERTRQNNPLGFLPEVSASSEAFFQRCKSLSALFFTALFHRFVSEILPHAPKQYAREVAHLEKSFTDVAIIDGSRLDKIAHRLKILWDEKAAVLPGCLMIIYDLYRGFARQVWFHADAAAAEFNRAFLAIECLQEGTLLIGDRLYCSAKMFTHLEAKQCFGVFRRSKAPSIRKVRRLSRIQVGAGFIEDCLVKMGPPNEAIDLRLITLKVAGRIHEALTNVLDPERLSAKDVVALYPLRWKIERLFYDLKVVLDVERFYAANPNAVAMQVYAAAMVHTAFRIAQADLARKVRLPAESLSTEKLFPFLALASIKILEAEFFFEATCQANPGITLKKPSWKALPGTVVLLEYLLVQRRSSVRKKKSYDEERRKWKSLREFYENGELS
jgi:hypothetical protein